MAKRRLNSKCFLRTKRSEFVWIWSWTWDHERGGNNEPTKCYSLALLLLLYFHSYILLYLIIHSPDTSSFIKVIFKEVFVHYFSSMASTKTTHTHAGRQATHESGSLRSPLVTTRPHASTPTQSTPSSITTIAIDVLGPVVTSPSFFFRIPIKSRPDGSLNNRQSSAEVYCW